MEPLKETVSPYPFTDATPPDPRPDRRDTPLIAVPRSPLITHHPPLHQAGERPDARVTAVVLTYNRRAEVLRTLDRLSSLPERPPLIVVDNGSTDGTPSAVASEFPQACTIRFDRNLGAAARNAGIAAASTPYVALCDDDTWWHPGSLARAGALLDGAPRLAVLTGTVLVGSREQIDPTSRSMAQSPLPPRDDVPGLPILGFLAGASVVRRTAFLQVGGFEPRFFIGGEETLVAWDLAATGWEMAYRSDLVVHHCPSTLREPGGRRSCLLRNAVWSAWLRLTVPSAVRRTLRLMGRESDMSSRSWALREALAGLPWILRRRHVIPPTVEAELQRLGLA
nr:glycosyltransferase [Nitrospira moscoviensis]